MSRVLIAGFLHETNTFSPTPARWENFVNGEGFPGMRLGAEVLELSQVNVPIGGFIDEADAGWELIPAIWCAASPSGPVQEETFERVWAQIEKEVREASPDAVYLDLHGAMVAEHQLDGDGELIRRTREIVGPEIPIVCSLDLHANISDLMLETADAMVAYRTYPHIDMAETGVRAARLLSRLLAGEELEPFRADLDFLIPTISGSTLEGPAAQIYEHLAEIEDGDGVLSFAMAFPATDVPECRPCIFGYGGQREELVRRVGELAAKAADLEAEFVLEALPAKEAVEAAVAAARRRERVVIADTQDNPGAGGDARTTGLLRELLDADAPGTALAALWYPEVVQAAVEAGIGGVIDVTFAGVPDVGDAPLSARFEVADLTDGRVTFDGPMMHGNRLALGPSALLRHGNTLVIVNSHKAQIMDRNQFRSAGAPPEEQSVLALKSSVHFRGDFSGIADRIIVALAPGPFPADPAQLPWRNLTEGVRLGPLGPVFSREGGTD